MKKKVETKSDWELEQENRIKEEAIRRKKREKELEEQKTKLKKLKVDALSSAQKKIEELKKRDIKGFILIAIDSEQEHFESFFDPINERENMRATQKVLGLIRSSLDSQMSR